MPKLVERKYKIWTGACKCLIQEVP